MFIPKANGKLRPLGISTELRQRVRDALGHEHQVIDQVPASPLPKQSSNQAIKQSSNQAIKQWREPLDDVCAITLSTAALRRRYLAGARERTASGRTFGPVLLREIFENLNADFLRDRAFDPAHAVPEPDDLALLFDVHESTSRE